MNLLNLMASVSVGSGDGLVHSLVSVLIIALCVGIVYGIGWYFFSGPPSSPVVMKVWNGIFILILGLVLINFLMSLGGHQFIAW